MLKKIRKIEIRANRIMTGVIGICLSLWLFCSCATTSQKSVVAPVSELPAETSINDQAGQRDWLYLTLRLEDGEELLFNVDTGAPFTVLDQSLAPKLGKRLNNVTLRYAWKESTGNVYAAPKLFLGGARLRTGERVWTDDLKRNLCRTSNSPPVRGILGMDCLRHYCVQLDFGAKRMRFLDPDQVDAKVLGKAFPLVLDRAGYVTTRACFTTAKSVSPILDTGCLVDGVLGPEVFELALREHNAAWTNQFNDPSGFRRCLAFFPEAEFDGEVYADVFLEKAPAMLWKGRYYYVNAVGLPFLARHLVTLNFPARTMYLRRYK